VAAVRQEMRRRGEEITALAIERLREIGILAEVVIMRGNPDFLISFAARKWPADLILVRAHNRTDFRNWLLGSVAKSVVEGAPCSVQVVRAPDEERSIADNRSMRILLATDGSGASLAAAQAVAETTWPENTEVKVVSVVNPMIYSLEEIGLLRDRGTDRAHRAIGDAIKVLRTAPLSVSGELIAGRAAGQIRDRASDWSADLIVVGTHEGRGLKRFLSGSTSATVAKRAHCSVSVIRGRSVSQNEKSLPSSSSSSVPTLSNLYRFDYTRGWRKAA
jgi:nucleotide-binding universal stress UspA family protein